MFYAAAAEVRAATADADTSAEYGGDEGNRGKSVESLEESFHGGYGDFLCVGIWKMRSGDGCVDPDKSNSLTAFVFVYFCFLMICGWFLDREIMQVGLVCESLSGHGQ